MNFKARVKLLTLIAAFPIVCFAQDDQFRIAAASSMQFAIDEVIEAYTKQPGSSVPTVVYGSSGNLFRQIVQGAPYEIFVSARGELTEKLFRTKNSKNSGEIIGTGRLVLLSDSTIEDSKDLTEIINTEISINKNKLAVANPAHAPYGRAAVQVLEALEILSSTRPQLVIGEQVSQATRFVVSGAAPYGLVSLSLALSPAITSKTQYLLIDNSLHEPIELRVVKLNSAGLAAQQFYDFFLSDQSVDNIFKRYGLR